MSESAITGKFAVGEQFPAGWNRIYGIGFRPFEGPFKGSVRDGLEPAFQRLSISVYNILALCTVTQ